MAHKHKLKFIQVGYAGGQGIVGWSYRFTWDFVCNFCPYTYRADRDGMIKLMTGKRYL